MGAGRERSGHRGLVPLCRLLDVSVEWLLGGSPIERETFEAVVMVTTVQGYAERSRAESPRALAAWINGLHHTVTEAMRHFDGVPVKYVGDGALAFFSGPGMTERRLRNDDEQDCDRPAAGWGERGD